MSKCRESWSQVASDVIAQKYFRKAGVPARLKKVEEANRPVLAVALGARYRGRSRRCPRRSARIGEQSSKQVFERLAGTWTYWGWKGGHFE